MKSITIGRESSNQYVIFDSEKYVGRHHAVLKIHDDKKVFIQDLGSANGTFVNGKEIPKLIDVPINWGDSVNFAEVENLNWGRISSIVDANISTYTIGTKAGNAIVLHDNTGEISRNHAVIEVHKDGSVYLTDYSSNGTWVNGQPVHNSKVQVRRGDAISFANVQALNWDNIPDSKSQKGSLSLDWKWIAIPAAVVVLGMIGYMGFSMIGSSSPDIYNKYKNSIGLVYQEYFEVVTDKMTKDTLFIIGEGQLINYDPSFISTSRGLAKLMGFDLVDYKRSSLSLPQDIKPFVSLGSSFLVSEDGKFITNRHVSSANKRTQEEEDMVESVLGFVTSQTTLGYIQPEIQPVNKYIGFAPNEKELDDRDIKKNLIEAEVLKEAFDPDVDLTLMQLKTKKLPEGTTKVDIEKDIITKIEDIRIGSDAIIFGYPVGLDLGLKGGEKILKASYNEGVISKISNKYEVQYDIPSFMGASGSPVFDKKTGKLIAINYSKVGATQGFNFGIIATHIDKLFD